MTERNLQRSKLVLLQRWHSTRLPILALMNILILNRYTDLGYAMDKEAKQQRLHGLLI